MKQFDAVKEFILGFWRQKEKSDPVNHEAPFKMVLEEPKAPALVDPKTGLFSPIAKPDEFTACAGTLQPCGDPRPLKLYNGPAVESILGEGYGEKIVWTHEDDQFVDFQIVRTIIVDDIAFFLRYVNCELTTEEKDVYPYFYAPCFAEVNEVVATAMQIDLLELNEDQGCFFAIFQNTLGLLLISKSDADEIQRRRFGFEDVPDRHVYQMTFMRFDQKAIERMDIAGTVKDAYEAVKALRDPLRVNFATYNENE